MRICTTISTSRLQYTHVVLFGSYDESFDVHNAVDVSVLSKFMLSHQSSWAMMKRKAKGADEFVGDLYTLHHTSMPTISIHSDDYPFDVYVALVLEGTESNQTEVKLLKLVFTNKVTTIPFHQTYHSHDHLLYKADETINSEFTYCVWFFAESDHPGCLFSHQQRSVYLQQFGTMYFTGSKTFVLQKVNALPERYRTLSWNDGLWHQLCMTYKQGHLQMFVDGISFGRSIPYPWTPNTSAPLFFNGSSNSTSVFCGSLCNAVLLTRALPPFEIQVLYNNRNPVHLPRSYHDVKQWCYTLNGHAAADDEDDSNNQTLQTLPLHELQQLTTVWSWSTNLPSPLLH